MPHGKTFVNRGKVRAGRPGARIIGIRDEEPLKIVRQVQGGFRFERLVELQKATELSWEALAGFVGIAPRTLVRRQSDRRLRPDESDRVLRAATIFDLATELFEGDAGAARQWLQTPQPGLGGGVPLEIASTEVGAREVEKLMGRLEDGVFA